jgi:hypothetical protein
VRSAFAFAGVAVSLWGLFDAIARPGWAWADAHKSKRLWIGIQVVGLFVFGGFVPAGIYLVAIRPSVRAAQHMRAIGNTRFGPGDR